MISRLLTVALALGLCAPAAVAQPNGGNQRPVDPAVRRERVKKRIRAMRAATLVTELQLDEQAAGKLFPVLGRYDDEFEKLLLARADIQRRLGEAADKNAKQIDKIIDEAVANQRAFWDVEDKRLGELRKILTPVQTARLMIVLPALERRIQNQLQKAIGAAGGPGGPKGRGAMQRDLDELEDEEAPKPAPPPRNPPPAARCDPFDSRHGCPK